MVQWKCRSREVPRDALAYTKHLEISWSFEVCLLLLLHLFFSLQFTYSNNLTSRGLGDIRVNPECWNYVSHIPHCTYCVGCDWCQVESCKFFCQCEINYERLLILFWHSKWMIDFQRCCDIDENTINQNISV